MISTQYFDTNTSLKNFLFNNKVEENRKTRLHKLWDHCVMAVKIDHKRKREVNYRGVLTAGRYIIVPTTYKVGDSAGYMLRVFSQSDLNLRFVHKVISYI